MNSVQFITIDEQNLNQRIDNFLHSRLKKVPKNYIYRIIRKGEVRVNKKRVKPTYKLQISDVVRVPPTWLASSDASAVPSEQLLDALRARILFQDEQMLVLDKPAGLAVHGGSGLSFGAIEALRVLLGGDVYLELVHRLDKGTSGCLILAKKRSFLRYLQSEIRARRVRKIYHALMFGKLNKAIRCDAPLLKTHHSNGERLVRVDADGKESLSVFRPIRLCKNGHTLVEIDIKTGRTHQIRAHARHIGHPVLGDDKYASSFSLSQDRRLSLRRMCLHAHSLSFALSDGSDFHIESDANFGVDLT